MNLIQIVLVIISILIIGAVAIQGKGTGLSIVPGSGDFGKFERRGPEKTLHQATIILIALFIIISAYSYFVS